jgi:PAS domain-containing protein
MTAVSQRIATPDGSFAGVVTVALDLSYFSGLYAVIVGNSGASVMLVHREGVVQLRVPPLEGIVGESFRDSKLFSEYLLKSDRGSYQTSAGMDGVPRVVGYRAVKNVPLVALFSYPRANVLAPWYRNLYIYGSVTALQLIIIMIGTGVLVRRAGALVEAKKSIEDSNARFVIATSNMSQGLAVFDADRRLVMCNERYAKIYDLDVEQVKPGTSSQESPICGSRNSIRSNIPGSSIAPLKPTIWVRVWSASTN